MNNRCNAGWETNFDSHKVHDACVVLYVLWYIHVLEYAFWIFLSHSASLI